MSSGTKYDSDAGRNVSMNASDKFLERSANLGLSPRQQELNFLWSIYRCSQYDIRKVDWDGYEHQSRLEMESVATASFVPPGFYDGQMMPLKFRRPTAPYNLVKVIVDRFTGLLFSERRHPTFRVEGDPDTEDFVHALAEASRLWQAMIKARTFGGATGSVAIGFQFVDGKPVIEVHDPRWLIPDFKDRHTLELNSVEKRYIYPVEMRDDKGRWIEVPYWYRRVVDQRTDTVFAPMPVEDGQEPNWEPDVVVEHNFGFCPVKWIQNLPVIDSIDGDPDCLGIFETCEAIDALLAQANRGTVANCDPTLKLITDSALAELKKGSNNAIKLPVGSSADYLEISGSGPKAARELAQELRAMALEVAQCVLEHPDAAQKTATEIERVYSSMLSKADIMREQYGQNAVLPVMDMMVRAARKLTTVSIQTDANGVPQKVRGSLALPPKVVKDTNDPQAQATKVDRKLGPGGVLQLSWPRYFEPTLMDVSQASDAAGKAKMSGLIDDEHASTFVAEYYDVEDVPAMLKKVKDEAAERAQEMEAMMMKRMAGAAGPGGGGPPKRGM